MMYCVFCYGLGCVLCANDTNPVRPTKESLKAASDALADALCDYKPKKKDKVKRGKD